METTTNYGLKKPGQDEFYDVGDFNDNMDKIDAELKKCSEAAGNPMEAVTEFKPATDRENIKSGEKLGTALGKIAKFLADLKAAAFKSVANNLTTTEEGSVLDARQGAVLQEEIDQVNSDLTEQYVKFPNLTNPVAKSGNWTADASGWLYYYSVSAGDFNVIKVNDVKVHVSKIGGTQSFPVEFAGIIPIRKDDKITVSVGTYGSLKQTFFPD